MMRLAQRARCRRSAPAWSPRKRRSATAAAAAASTRSCAYVCAYGSEIDARIERPQESHIKQIVESLSHGSGAINHDAVLNADIPTPSVRLVEDYERTNKPNFQLRNAGTTLSYAHSLRIFALCGSPIHACTPCRPSHCQWRMPSERSTRSDYRLSSHK